MKTSAAPTTSLPTNDIEDEQNDEKDRMDSNYSESTVQQSDNNTEFLTMDQSTTNQDDEYSSDKFDHDLIQVSCPDFDEQSNTNDQIQESSNGDFPQQNTESLITTTTNDQEPPFDHKFGEDEQHTNLSTDDNDGLSKR